MVRFYKKHGPQFRVSLTNNATLEFTSLDTLVGYFATAEHYVQTEFEKFAVEHRYGVSEITEVEFHREYVEKKSRSPQLGRVWREEVGVGAVRASTLLAQLGAEHVAKAVAVEGPGAKEEGTKLQSAPAAVAAPKQEFEPTVGKRKKKA